MQTSPTTTEQKAQSISQSSAEAENSKNYPLLMREQILNTPFYIVGTQDKGYFITYGKYRFNDEPIPHDTKKDLQDIGQEWIYDHQWDIVLHLIAMALTTYETEKDTLK